MAAINGHAIAGGCVLACAADYRVMAQRTGRIGIPELLVGVPFPTIALEIMRFVAAPQHVQTLLYGGTTFPPESAVERGLVDAMVAPEYLFEHAMHVAETLAALPLAAFMLTKFSSGRRCGSGCETMARVSTPTSTTSGQRHRH